jgi:uncharacterized RDD family membrane protein YckC
MNSNVSILRQLGAMLYDSFLVFSLLFSVDLMLLIVIDNQLELKGMWFYITTLPILYLYFSLSWVKGRQTLGMKAWRFQITTKNNKNITYKQAFIRLIIASLLVGIFYKFFNTKNLSVQDIVSHTILTKN